MIKQNIKDIDLLTCKKVTIDCTNFILGRLLSIIAKNLKLNKDLRIDLINTDKLKVKTNKKWFHNNLLAKQDYGSREKGPYKSDRYFGILRSLSGMLNTNRLYGREALKRVKIFDESEVNNKTYIINLENIRGSNLLKISEIRK